MTTLDDDLLELSMQHAAATPADATSLREALWRRLHAEGWKPATHQDRAYGANTGGSDRALLDAWLRGDPDAFEVLTKRHGGALLSFARGSLPDAEAQDAVQEAFIALFRKGSDVLARPDRSIRAFLFGATRIEMRNYHRRRLRAEQVLEKYAQELTADAPDVLHGLLQRERTQLVADLVAVCNPLEQAVVSMTFAGETNSDIADELGLTPNHVRVLKHRAHTKLTNAVAEEGEP